MNAARTVNLDHAFGALAHPVRRHILETTVRKGRGVTELTEEFDISLAAVSKHVKQTDWSTGGRSGRSF